MGRKPKLSDVDRLVAELVEALDALDDIKATLIRAQRYIVEHPSGQDSSKD